MYNQNWLAKRKMQTAQTHCAVQQCCTGPLEQVISILHLLFESMKPSNVTLHYHFGITTEFESQMNAIAPSEETHFCDEYYDLISIVQNQQEEICWLKKRTKGNKSEYSFKYQVATNLDHDAISYMEEKNSEHILLLLKNRYPAVLDPGIATLEEAVKKFNILANFGVNRYKYVGPSNCLVYLDSVQFLPGLYNVIGTIQFKHTTLEAQFYPTIPLQTCQELHIVTPVRSAIMSYLSYVNSNLYARVANLSILTNDTYFNDPLFSPQKYEYVMATKPEDGGDFYKAARFWESTE